MDPVSEYRLLTVVAAFVFAYSLIASRLARTPISGALVYVVVAMLVGPRGLDFVDFDIEGEGLRILAEFALAVCLFTDSATANLGILRRVRELPTRLLLIGLPLTIAAGFGVGVVLFEDLGFFEIALLATMLAPTDAALGKAVVSNPAVPAQVRESLNVESGLNDGICVPVLLLFLALAAGSVEQGEAGRMLLRLPLSVIGIGAIVGLGLGSAGANALKTCAARGWVAGTWLQIPIIALSLLCFGLAQWMGGSGFIASFAGGMTFGGLAREHKEDFLAAAEGTADALALVTWFAFGTILPTYLFAHLRWEAVVYALASLTVVRMVPVFFCLVLDRLHADTVLFLGWFGPRGLATVVFAVMALDALPPGEAIDTIITTISWTIALSIVAHGLSANGLARAYGARVEARGGRI